MARTSKFALSSNAQLSTAMWRAGRYLRLSVEDGDKEDDTFKSDSIANQEELIDDYLMESLDIIVEDTYSDDGYSGANFNRPDFQRLLEDIKQNKINCIIVKDLSRFGRDYLEVGKYVQIYFKEIGLRFISVLDNIDSYHEPDSVNGIGFILKNAMNEEHCRETSLKIRATFDSKREDGDYIGSFAPYGFSKDPDNKNKLIIDDETSEIVRLIFRLFQEGNAVERIAKILNESGIPSPSKQKILKGFKYRNSGRINDGLWYHSTVRNILTNRMLIGDMVQGRRRKVSYKTKKIINLNEEDWVIKIGTHEAIIDTTVFWNVQDLLKRDKRVSPKTKEFTLFAGYIHCADCGRAMQKTTNRSSRNQFYYYICSTYQKLCKNACSRHSIRSDQLEEAVFVVISKYIAMAVEMDEFIVKINESPLRNTEMVQTQLGIEHNDKKRLELERRLLALYPDWKDGYITRDQYIALKAQYETELEKIKLEIEKYKTIYSREKEGIDGSNDFIKNFLKFKGFKKLTREIIIALVKDIIVFEGGGIEIKFNFQDAFERGQEYIEANKDALADVFLKKDVREAI